jgi:hypothetical protein
MSERNNIFSIMDSIMGFLEQRLGRFSADLNSGGRIAESTAPELRSRSEPSAEREPRSSRARAASSAEREADARPNRARRRRGELLNGQSSAEQGRAGGSPYIGAILNLFAADLYSHLEAEEAAVENRSTRRPGRTLRFIIPQNLSNELRMAANSDGEMEVPLSNVIFEVQIYYDVLDSPFPSGPVAATKEELMRTKVLRGTKADECSECSICMANFVRNQKLRLLPCEHRFHLRCVDKWLLAHSNKCPICRAEVGG